LAWIATQRVSASLDERLTMMLNTVFNGWRMEDSVGDCRCSDTTRMMWLEGCSLGVDISAH
jgi:hypothetical protein